MDPDGEEMGIPPGLARFGRGLAQTAGGVLTIGGGFVIGVGASETIPGTMMGIGLISDGIYATTQGFHQMANVIAGRPESEDPKYSTVAGEVSNNKIVDNVVSGGECIVGNAANSIVKAATKKSITISASKTAPSTSKVETSRAETSKKPTTGTVASHGGSAICTGIGHHSPSTTNKQSSSKVHPNTSTTGKPRISNELIDL